MTITPGPTRRAGLRTLVAVAAAVAAVPLLGGVRTSEARDGGTTGSPDAGHARVKARTVPPLRLMTFNLRVAGSDEPNSWADRRPVMRELLRRAAPHVIGTQEGQLPQLSDIEADLGPHYAWIGTTGDGREESVAVYYDKRRLAPVEHTTFRLSDTPDVPGSNTWGAAFPRLVTRVRFRDLLDPGRQFHVLNTHLDHRSEYARERAAALIAERVAALGGRLPVLLTGDFNAAAHGSPAYDTLLDAGFVDTWDTARQRGPAYGTFHAFGSLTPDGERIDWILATPDVTVHRESVDTFWVRGQWPSDHLPVLASLSLGRAAPGTA
ncbi:endonuclease/exonuclease/phosphatase family protein [Streptomyces adustus]|uniref:Endonuclease/exonuclease/phosphatase family protein n=1 Tax=Streptomyces adustus TaxID=1609272 RepID=A0A5N8VFY3_9ACTN|nr:endonuclease/exonuclease/phosphatase family protein [Streptomyces adustus]MPY33736.1 endonuclease/exonuclease/phosphatase family protein [Streptomyces adustus]